MLPNDEEELTSDEVEDAFLLLTFLVFSILCKVDSSFFSSAVVVLSVGLDSDSSISSSILSSFSSSSAFSPPPTIFE
jgi:hypothetical protein